MASGKPLSPSAQAMKTFLIPRPLISSSIPIQNFDPSFSLIHEMDMSFIEEDTLKAYDHFISVY